MAQFRQTMWVALLAGVSSGLVLFYLQHLTIQPLIASAEVYEARAEQMHNEESFPSTATGDNDWHPAEGWQRTSLTALATILTGIGFAALLFGFASMWSVPMTTARGLRWGLAGFACFVLAPSLGLPPEPPGVLAADLQARQIWWLATVAATAGGLLLLSQFRQRGLSQGFFSWLTLLAGIVALFLPHAIGAPQAPREQIVPDDLIRQFQIASIATSAIFWILLGTFGGYLSARFQEIVE